jgi:hypothetical protein
MQFKSKYNSALSWGRNEMNSAQSPVSGLALFPKVRKPSTTQSNISLRPHGIPSWQFWGLVPFPYRSNQSTTHHCRDGRNEVNQIKVQHTTVVMAAMN